MHHLLPFDSLNTNIRNVAKLAGVSVGTVSNVLNRPNQVSVETRLKVKDAIDLLVFMPNAAINSKGTDSNVIGVILPLSSNPFYEELTLGIDMPGTVSILGYDNTSYAESGLIPLSSVSQTPFHLGQTMGRQMVTDLFAEAGHAHQHVVFQPQLVERTSTQRRD